MGREVCPGRGLDDLGRGGFGEDMYLWLSRLLMDFFVGSMSWIGDPPKAKRF